MNAQRLIEALEDAGYEAQRYSGRGMRGRECVGIVTQHGESAFCVGVKLALTYEYKYGMTEANDLIKLKVSEDSMGLDSIVYFESVAWPEDAAASEV